VLRTRDTCTHGQLKALSCQQINDLSMATKYKSSLPFLLLPVIRDTPSGKVSGLLVVAVDVLLLLLVLLYSGINSVIVIHNCVFL